MRDAGKLSASIEIIDQFFSRKTPLKTIISDWGRNNRYAGAKDRAWISGLCLDILRHRQSLADHMGEQSARALALSSLRYVWGVSAEHLQQMAAEEPHGPGALSEEETAKLSHEIFVCGRDFPEWLSPHITRIFGDDAEAEMQAFTQRADVDLRLNTLKAEPEKSLKALASVKAGSLPQWKTAARIAAPSSKDKQSSVTVIPAFNKGWFEVQDFGSQIAASAAGNVNGAQVLDYCAGGGGKTLALAAMMNNTGQLYAYDRDPRRLSPLFHRAKRAGLRNLQVRSPAGNEGLDDLDGKMDVVFLDAPCTGIGTWRRHPDTKWRLTERQLETRMSEQDLVLAQAHRFVKPGGRIVWVTCSVLIEENEDRLAAFLSANPTFKRLPVLDQIAASGLATDEGLAALQNCVTQDGALRLTPKKLNCDGFYVAVLQQDA